MISAWVYIYTGQHSNIMKSLLTNPARTRTDCEDPTPAAPAPGTGNVAVLVNKEQFWDGFINRHDLSIHYIWLVVWNMFFHIGNFIIPTDELIFFRGVGIPPTSC
jgi:hypothetical protein